MRNDPRQVPPLEFIEDAALKRSEHDRLGHTTIADELLELVKTVPYPSTIGLLGSWGSGKSGIGELLRQRVQASQDFEFVRIDAFRHEGLALSREFVREVADALKIPDDDELRNLNKTTETSRKVLRLGRSGWIALGITILIVFGISAGLLAWSAIVNPVHGQDFWQTLAAKAPQLIPALLPGALIGAIVVLFGRNLSVDTKTEPAKEADEFGQAYRKAIERTERRVVIFIDELDRCSASQVVATLDTLRTFLGIDRCIYVVAVDQQVVERAARIASTQVTPADPQNPHHSAGSAYIDKVFQYRVHVPVIRSRRVTRFATDLVESLGGLWEEFDRRALIQVLVPTHVRSPRRVKALVNSFAVSYRVLGRRIAADFLSVRSASTRATELAKLVALRLEFPLFAEDLAKFPSLVDLVLQVADGASIKESDGHSKELIDLAHAYANRERPLDENLASDGSEATDQTNRVQVDQLIGYLRKTRAVIGPRDDLIYLEDAGNAFGLSGDIADQIEAAAANADFGELEDLVRNLDPNRRIQCVRLLAVQAKELDTGVELSNLLSGLAVVSKLVSTAELTMYAPEIMQALSRWEATELPTRALAQFLRIASLAGEPGRALIDRILSSDDILEEGSISPTDLLSSPHLRNYAGVPRTVARYLVREDEVTVDRTLAEMSELPLEALQLLDNRFVTTIVDFVEKGQERVETTSPRASSRSSTNESEELVKLRHLIARSSVLPPVLREPILAAALSAGHSARTDAMSVLPNDVMGEPLSIEIVKEMPRQLVQHWAKYLTRIRIDVDLDSLADLEYRAIRDTCKLGEDVPPDQFGAVLEAISDLRGRRAEDPDLSRIFDDNLQSGDGSLGQVTYAFNMLACLSVAINKGRVTASAVPRAAAVFAELLSLEPAGGGNLIDSAEWLALCESMAAWLIHAQRPAVDIVIGAARVCPWLPADRQLELTLAVIGASNAKADLEEIVSRDEVRETIRRYRGSASRIVNQWISADGDAVAVFDSFQDTWIATASPMVHQSIRERSARDKAFRLELARLFISNCYLREVNSGILESLAVDQLPVAAIADWLEEAQSKSATVDQRGRVLRCWESLDIKQRKASERLISSVFMPIARSNKGGLRHAARYIGLIAHASASAREQIREDLIGAAGSDEGLAKEVQEALIKAGLLKRRSIMDRVFGREPARPTLSDEEADV